MFYRPPMQGQIHNIRAVADFAVKGVEVLALAREFDLVKTWNWTASASAILKTRSEFDIDALAVMKMPWPYKHRCAAFSSKGGDLLDERGNMTIVFDSCLPVRLLLVSLWCMRHCIQPAEAGCDRYRLARRKEASHLELRMPKKYEYSMALG